MPQFVVAIGVSLMLAIMSGGILTAQSTLITLQGAQANLNADEAAAPWARSQVTSAIAGAIQTNPTTPLTAAVFPTTGWTSGAVTATAVLEGDSYGSTTGPLLCANLELNPAISERCVAVDVTITTGYPTATLSERDVLRVFDISPYYRWVGAYRLGSMTDRATTAAADAGGCSGTGLGCDQNQVQSADSQTLTAGQNCTLGTNSGTCPASNVFDKSTYGNANWTNGQTSQGTSQ